MIDRVFHPFFTTKPVGKGSGLGLSQVLGLAQQMGGGVQIRSAPGSGTKVAIFLPAMAPVAARGGGGARTRSAGRATRMGRS